MKTIVSVGSVIAEGFSTIISERKWRMIPVFVYFLAISIVLAFVNAVSPIAPFVYSLF